MRLLIEVDIQDKNVPIWSYSTGIIRYEDRTLQDCKRYVTHFLEYVSGIQIIKIKKVT